MLTQLFNSFVGCIGIYEYSDRGIELIRVNDRTTTKLWDIIHRPSFCRKKCVGKAYSEQDKEKLWMHVSEQ
jgi:hypothetical protein